MRTRIPIVNTGMFLGLRVQVPLESVGNIGSYIRGGGKDSMQRSSNEPMISAQLMRPAGTG